MYGATTAVVIVDVRVVVDVVVIVDVVVVDVDVLELVLAIFGACK